jgi:hypothetical protein
MEGEWEEEEVSWETGVELVWTKSTETWLEEEEGMSKDGKSTESIGETIGWTKEVSLDGTKKCGEGKRKHPSELGCKRLVVKGNICSLKITCLEVKADLVWRLYNL